MPVYLVIGEMGMGKSTHVKERFMDKWKREIMAYNLIADDFEGIPCIHDFDEYLDEAVYKSNTLMIVDEASTCIPEKKPNPRKPFGKKILTWFVNSRKCNNPVFIIYHSYKDVPLWVLMYSNFMIRFNTMDMLDIQKRRFRSYPKVVESFEDFPTIPKFKFCDIVIRKAE